MTSVTNGGDSNHSSREMARCKFAREIAFVIASLHGSEQQNPHIEAVSCNYFGFLAILATLFSCISWCGQRDRESRIVVRTRSRSSAG